MPSPLRAIALALLTACAPPRDAAPDTLEVQTAASLSAPTRVLLDSFTRRTGTVVREEHGASLELVRRVTELHRVPDVIVLADHELFPDLLVPSAATWYAPFARDHMVVAWTARSRHGMEMRRDTWWRTLLRDDVLVGRTDPEQAPAGYRALLMYALAERFYREPSLADRLAARSPPRLQRANASELAALLEAGELDYIVDYESVARAHHFRWVPLPPEIDLGDAARAAAYAGVSVRVRRGRDSVTLRGAPILSAVSVPRGAPHPAAAERFVAFMLGAEGRALLAGRGVSVLERPELVGDRVPRGIRAAVQP